METVIYQGELYREVGKLGDKNGCSTGLLRGENGAILVYKEISEELLPIYKKLQTRPHPNVVQVLDFTVCEGKTAVLLEYFPSISLEEKLIKEEKLSLEEAKRIALQICDAVYCFSGMGIVHRDLSPANILINGQGLVKITDFGISRLYKKNQQADTTIMGTPGYAAPEQFGFAQTDGKADIFSIGVLLNRMLTGRFPNEELYRGNREISRMIQRCLKMSAAERCDLEELEAGLGGKRKRKRPFGRCMAAYIPGFRTGNKVHMIVAAIDYWYMCFSFLLVSVSWKGNWAAVLSSVLGLWINTLVIGWFIGSFSTVAYRLHMDHGWRKGSLILLYTVLSLCILAIGYEFMM